MRVDLPGQVHRNGLFVSSIFKITVNADSSSIEMMHVQCSAQIFVLDNHNGEQDCS